MAKNLNYSVMVDGSGNITYPTLSTFKNVNGLTVDGISYYSMLSGNTYDIDNGHTTINAAFAYVSADMYAISTNMLKRNTYTDLQDGSGGYYNTTIDMRSGFEVKTSSMYGGWGMKLCSSDDSYGGNESDFIVSLSDEMRDDDPFDNYDNCFIKLTNHRGWEWETCNAFIIGARLIMPLFTESNTQTASSVEIRPVIKSDGTISLTVVAVND